MYQVQTQEFVGPLDKLLELIEEKRLDITRISLAEVTADFIVYVQDMQARVSADSQKDQSQSARILADFLVVASHLLLIKSKALLPDLELTQEEEEGIFDLERRLKLYSDIKPLFALVKKTWGMSTQSFSREFLSHIPSIFYPASNATPDALAHALGKLLQSLGTFVVEQETIERQLFSLEEKITELSQMLLKGISRFSQIAESKSRGEVIVLFLALLHLLRDQTLTVRQDNLFGEMQMEMINNH